MPLDTLGRGKNWRDHHDLLAEWVAFYRENACNMSELSREAGVKRSTARSAMHYAHSIGLLDSEEINPNNAPSSATYAGAMEQKRKRFAAKAAKGTWRKPVLAHVQEGPFILKLFGDPHLDADGCNVDLFQREWLRMDGTARIYGACVGDWFNNWKKSMAHLWKGEGDPSDAWIIFEHLMDQRGADLLAACSGNHDDWTHAPFDPIELIMRQNGVIYRKGAVRLLINAGSAVTVAIRHKWRGNSQYNAAHGLKKAAFWGWEDDLFVGGHIHQDEDGRYVSPEGEIVHLCQLSAFKEFDDYVDVEGFMGPRIQPVRNAVINPSRPRTDPERVNLMFDHDAAVDRLAFEVRRAA